MENKLNRLLKECKEEQDRINIPYWKGINKVKINTRAKSRLGACRVKKRAGIITAYEIEVSDEIAGCSDEDIKCIIHHELLHTCRGCMNHGLRWKEYAAKLNRIYGYEISRLTSYEKLGIERAERVKAPKYVIKCTGCGAEIIRYKRCKLVENIGSYKCGKCGAPLKLQ